MTDVDIGIDPGTHGAIAAIRGDEILLLADTPLCAEGYDRRRMLMYLHEAMRAAHPWTPRLTIERQKAYGQGVVSAFSTGLGYGMWLMAATACGLEPRIVETTDWVPRMVPERPKRLKRTEAKWYHVEAAAKLFPDAELAGPRGGARDGRADALLLACYGRSLVGAGGSGGVG